MNNYETKYAIGDLVYIANKYDVDREVIKAIKIVGLNGKISYGIESKRSADFWGLWGCSDRYTWYKSSEVFLDKESAVALHENLKAKEEAKEALQEAKAKQERKQSLLEELKELEDN